MTHPLYPLKITCRKIFFNMEHIHYMLQSDVNKLQIRYITIAHVY